MNAKYRVLAVLVAATLLRSAHAAPPQPTVDVVAADSTFGFRLLHAVQNTNPRANVVLSPVSAALDLSMVLDGTDGETRQQMLSTLSLEGAQQSAVDEANALLITSIRTPVPGVTLSVADSLWVDSRHATLRPEYLHRAQSWSDAKMTGLDFSDPGAAAQIDSWVANETQGKIPKIVGRIDPADRVLLLNALYFKGQWTHKFDKAQTQLKSFTLDGGPVKQVPRMAQSGRFEYLETPLLQAIRLPFGNGDLVMTVVLPAQSSSLEALQAQLTLQQWQSWDAQFKSRGGTIELPRFELKIQSLLNEALESLGMQRAFQKDAQFADMLSSTLPQEGGAHFFISSVLQSTFWKVDEDGSEAAAATSVGIAARLSARQMEPFRMIVDRPFFCAIEDRRSGALLFIGAIHDPTAG